MMSQSRSRAKKLASIVLILALALLFSLFYFSPPLPAFSAEELSAEFLGEQDYALEVFVTPGEFGVEGTGELKLKLKNLSGDYLDVEVAFQTHRNVVILMGNRPLEASAGNYTYSNRLNPGEESIQTFILKASLDRSVEAASYKVKIHANIEGSTENREVSFTVRR